MVLFSIYIIINIINNYYNNSIIIIFKGMGMIIVLLFLIKLIVEVMNLYYYNVRYQLPSLILAKDIVWMFLSLAVS